MGESYSKHLVHLCALVLLVGLATTADLPALAQGTENVPQLERIDIEAPRQRPAARSTATPAAGADYEEPAASSLPSEDRRGASEVFSASGIPSATRSLVTDKSTVSMSAASLPAQVQTITSQDIQQLNVWGREPADLFMRTAGVNAYYYNQGTLGLGIGMRGFTTANDIGFWVDGVPQNYPSEIGHGRVILQWLNPEAIERIEVIKGPFSALYGNFAEAGVINIITKKSDPSSSFKVEGGSFGSVRALGILSTESLIVTPFLAQDYYSIDGYRENSQLKQGSTFDKFSVPIFGGTLSLRYSYF